MGGRTETRDALAAALETDLIGPFEADEVLHLPPSRWYLTGFLAAMDARLLAEPADDDLGAGSEFEAEEAGPAEAGPQSRHFLPASLGLSVLLPPAAGDTESVTATASWADYRAEDAETDDGKHRFWRRLPREPIVVRVPLDARTIARGLPLPGAPGIFLSGKLATASKVPGLPAGARALSLFLVNQRPGEKGKEDERFLFQVRLELEFDPGFLPRPNWRGEDSADFDERIADLQFRDKVELVVGHGVAARALPSPDGVVRRVATTWLPTCEVPRVSTRKIDGVETRMEALARLADPAALRAALDPIPAAYSRWLAEQALVDPATAKRRETRDFLLADARRACARIEEGIALLTRSAEVRLAFQLMNSAMASQARRGRPHEEPSWRLFQLAFVLLSLPSIADADHPDRELVELIYFPTGGGKTEAYLGVIATVLLLRRLRGAERPDGGDGVAVLLRYTLRLLTLDQLSRAATLICALELLRADRPELGKTRFAIGLWVGKSASANTLKDVAGQIVDWKNQRTAPNSPLPITLCPWCRTPIERDGVRLYPPQQPQEVLIHCQNDECAFHPDTSADGLPVLFVDEQIYRELPAFLIATVDKLAMLPWRGETGLLFGRATSRVGRRFYGPLDRPPKDGRRLPAGLRPPELIVQDELHLISGPLGTMVGLYESVVEELCRAPQRPKILAATATVRQATAQVRALFGRPRPALFPPPGAEDGETFFAHLDHDAPGRLYLGVAAPGRAMKALLLRVYVALLAAAQKAWSLAGNPREKATADAYMTLVGYFNSLRELGGMRRLVEDEVVRLCHSRGERRPEGGGGRRLFQDRRLQPEPLELTSRETTSAINETKDRLGRRHDERGHVDVLLASNMISVGVDIPRLGLMVVAGQPKTTAEYIQASSRVGRLPEVGPGLVVTCYNVHKARDRSHYEHFSTYHQSFYRDVEASSLTPFSTRALDRGLAATLVALTRLMDPAMTPNAAAITIGQHRAAGEAAVRALAERARNHRSLSASEEAATEVEQLAKSLLDTWERVVRAAHGGGGRTYSGFDLDKTGGRPLLFQPLDENAPPRNTDDARFEAPTSMRDVEPSVDLWLERQPLGGWRP